VEIGLVADRLTDATIKRLPLPAKASKIHPDGDVPGFGVRVTANGARSFVLRYRVRGSGRERTYTVGSTGDWQTTAARSEAQRLRRLIDQGGDPLGDIERQRTEPTVADLIERFLTEHVEPRLRPGTVRHYRRLIDRHIRPHFGAHIKVADVSFADLDRLHRKISKGGASMQLTASSRSARRCSRSPCALEHARRQSRTWHRAQLRSQAQALPDRRRASAVDGSAGVRTRASRRRTFFACCR
jgi:hypothetical protein